MACYENSKSKIEIVAFDFFDTLVHRYCDPENIISNWAKSIIIRYGLPISSSYLYYLRKDSEIAIVKERRNAGYKNIMRKIYDSLNSSEMLNGIDFYEFYATSYDTEMDLELRNIYIDGEMLERARTYYDANKTLIIVSDFYLGKEFLSHICDELHLPNIFFQIYVSCDYNARKSTGELYKKVLEEFEIVPSQLLMIGDNVMSDQRVPKKMGINIEPCKTHHNPHFYLKMKELRKCLQFKYNLSNLFNGYSGVMYYFISKLYRLANSLGCKKLLFCSREGQILKTLFDIYQEKLDEKDRILTEYIYISRRATFLASLQSAENEDFSRMFLNYAVLKITDFLDNLGFSEQEINDLLDITDVKASAISMPRGYDRTFDNFLSSESFIKYYNRKRDEVKTLFRDYIYQFVEDSSLWIVDIGWRGTIQDNIYSALENRIKITGFYFGLKDAKQTEDNKKIGIVFNNNDNVINYDLMSFNHLDLEKVCAANHGPVNGYYKDEDIVYPDIVNSKKELAIYNYVQLQQNNLIREFRHICEVFECSIFDYIDASYLLKSQYLYHLCVNQSEYYKYYYGYRDIVVENFGAKKTIVKNTFTFKGYSEQFRWGMVNYVFRVLDRAHLQFLYPAGKMYCRLVYILKKYKLKFLKRN